MPSSNVIAADFGIYGSAVNKFGWRTMLSIESINNSTNNSNLIFKVEKAILSVIYISKMPTLQSITCWAVLAFIIIVVKYK